MENVFKNKKLSKITYAIAWGVFWGTVIATIISYFVFPESRYNLNNLSLKIAIMIVCQFIITSFFLLFWKKDIFDK